MILSKLHMEDILFLQHGLYFIFTAWLGYREGTRKYGLLDIHSNI